jgi:hypothetical protein
MMQRICSPESVSLSSSSSASASNSFDLQYVIFAFSTHLYHFILFVFIVKWRHVCEALSGRAATHPWVLLGRCI